MKTGKSPCRPFQTSNRFKRCDLSIQRPWSEKLAGKLRYSDIAAFQAFVSSHWSFGQVGLLRLWGTLWDGSLVGSKGIRQSAILSFGDREHRQIPAPSPPLRPG